MFFRIWLTVEQIADTAHGFQIDRLSAVLFRLFADPFDVDHDGIVVYNIFIPNLTVELFLGKYLAGMLQKETEQGQLSGGQVYAKA